MAPIEMTVQPIKALKSLGEILFLSSFYNHNEDALILSLIYLFCAAVDWSPRQSLM